MKSPLERAASLLDPMRVLGRVLIDPAATRENQFAAWLASIQPPTCRRHPRTAPWLDSEATQQASFSGSDSHAWSERYWECTAGPPDENDGKFYPFEAVYYCSACHLAFALTPPEFQETSFKDFITDTAERAARRDLCIEFGIQIANRGSGFLLLTGLPGTGKTRLACHVLRQLGRLHAKHRDALYVRQGQLTTALRANYNVKEVILRRSRADEEEEQPTVLDITQRVRILIVDEIGCLPLANDERLLFDEMLKHRYDHRLPTVLVSNLPLADLKAFLGDAVADRIHHATGNGRFILQFSGESFRRGSGGDYLAGLP